MAGSHTEHPNTDASCGPVEAQSCTGHETATLVESIPPPCLSLFTDSQGRFRQSPHDRPIDQLFRRMLSEVQRRFLAKEQVEHPWNILGLQRPVLPSSLTGVNAQLLRARDTVSMEGSDRLRKKGLDWDLRAERGHNTAPNTDSHNFALNHGSKRIF